jgi:hypothetical protein
MLGSQPPLTGQCDQYWGNSNSVRLDVASAWSTNDHHTVGEKSPSRRRQICMTSYKNIIRYVYIGCHTKVYKEHVEYFFILL